MLLEKHYNWNKCEQYKRGEQKKSRNLENYIKVGVKGGNQTLRKLSEIGVCCHYPGTRFT